MCACGWRDVYETETISAHVHNDIEANGNVCLDLYESDLLHNELTSLCKLRLTKYLSEQNSLNRY